MEDWDQCMLARMVRLLKIVITLHLADDTQAC